MLTTLGIGIGVATLLAIVGIIQGLNQSFARQLAIAGDEHAQHLQVPVVVTGDWWKYRNRKNFTLAQMRGRCAQQSQLVDRRRPRW